LQRIAESDLAEFSTAGELKKHRLAGPAFAHCLQILFDLQAVRSFAMQRCVKLCGLGLLCHAWAVIDSVLQEHPNLEQLMEGGTNLVIAAELRNISKTFESRLVLSQISLAVEQHQVLALVGASGCGKSTTLRIIAGLEHPDHGDVMIQGRNAKQVAPHQRDIALVLQQGGYYDDLDVRANLMSAVGRKGTKPNELQKKMDWVVQVLELESYLQHRPYQLSGGLLQRMALGRGLMRACHMLLLDEPLNHLDTNLRTKLRQSIIEWQRETAQTIIYVTHDPVEAMSIGHKIAVMHEGKLLQCGVPEQVFNEPEHQIVASLLDANMRFYPARLEVHEGQGAIQLFRQMIPCRVATSSKSNSLRGELKVIVGLRADDVRFAEGRDATFPQLHGLVRVAVRPQSSCFHGSHTQWSCRTEQGEEVVANIAKSKCVPAALSDSTFIEFHVDDLQIFDAPTGHRIELE
jgi:multiple sugar transport system ATP-binding protein